MIMYRWHYYPLLLALAIVVGVVTLRTWNRESMFRRFNGAQLAAVSIVVALAVSLYGQMQFDKLREVRRDRNFYAALLIRRSALNTIELRHGQTSHGSQSSSQPMEPTSYYARHRGVGLFMESKAACASPCPVRYGIIGMGVGTLAAYGRPGDTFRFYELNPQVIGYSTGLETIFHIHSQFACENRDCARRCASFARTRVQ